MHDDVYTDGVCKSMYTDEPLPLKKKNKFTAQCEAHRTDLTGEANVELTGLPVNVDGITLAITGSPCVRCD